jgi:DNA-binding MarR family transcriptional regulator
VSPVESTARTPVATGATGLDELETRAWRSFLKSHAEIVGALDRELVAAHGITLGEYEVLAFLSEAADRRLRMCDLAGRVLISPGALTRRLTSLVARGWVERMPCPRDARVTYAVLTDEGLERLEVAAPTHVEGVRRHFVGRLGRTDLADLASALEKADAGPVT